MTRIFECHHELNHAINSIGFVSIETALFIQQYEMVYEPIERVTKLKKRLQRKYYKEATIEKWIQRNEYSKTTTEKLKWKANKDKWIKKQINSKEYLKIWKFGFF